MRLRVSPVVTGACVLALAGVLSGPACGGGAASNDTGPRPSITAAKPASASASGSPAAAQVRQSDPWEGVIVAPPHAKPRTVLTDTSGRSFDLAKETEGSLTLLYAGYTHCPDVCPQRMAEIAAALKALPPDLSRKIEVVFVTADPDRDTADLLRRWLDVFDTSFIGLRGSQAEVNAFQVEMGARGGERADLGGGNYSVNHPSFVEFFGPDNVAHILFPSTAMAAALVHDVMKLVNEGWKES